MNMQDSLDQVSNWCDNNHIVINLIKTKSMTIATRQKHQLSPLLLDLVLNGAKIDQVSGHLLLGITIDNKHRWDSHTNNVCITILRRVSLLSKLRYIVDNDTRKLFFSATLNLVMIMRQSCEPVWPSGKALLRLVSGRTSVRYRFGSPFSSKRLWFVDAVLWLCPSLPTKTLKWLAALPIIMQKSFWWWQCSDRHIISLSPPTSIPPSPLLPVPNKPYGFCGR